MSLDLTDMFSVWEKAVIGQKSDIPFPHFDINKFKSLVFSKGPSYYYLIDFYDFSINHLSPEFEKIHGLPVQQIKSISDILNLTHPEDMDFVKLAEEKVISLLNHPIGLDFITRYKVSYNFRYITASGNYELFNHQALVIAQDENKNFIKSINVHTNIDHITKVNSHKISLIGLDELPSYLDIEVYDKTPQKTSLQSNHFTNQEMEVIKSVGEHLSMEDISSKTGVSYKTMEMLFENILSRLNCKNLEELSLKSLTEGWV
ncbi:hypothetical protein IFO69_18990 [Echinicola sp. CAU 1574]|uniref:HTH luxR-type domain-containing protein n=1 Tax=Echinicola arenosa TaxID=2774144 RepID=A0ABR9APX9_9BACT|nr:LuxR C-terminal-related transcriptional regulator [Echinicola arenosa]MBD8490846.1 hypothetical protein [Echinicola arenosa]